MRRLKNICNLILFICISTAFTSCDNKIHLCDEWSEHTIIYGMLDVADTNTYLRISKAFLGEGNAYNMAQIADSSEYEIGEISVKMEKLINGRVVKTFDFEPEYSHDKKPGIFYNPDQIVYKAYTLGELVRESDTINIYNDYVDATFKITVINASGEEVTAQTKLVDPTLYVTVGRLHENPTIYKNLRFPTDISWTTSTNGERYSMEANLQVLEIMKNGDSIMRVIDRGLISTKTASNLTGTNKTFSIDDHPDGFFAFIEDNVPHTDKAKEDNVAYRKIRLYTLEFAMAGIDFDKYIQTTRGTGISQNQQVYSNVVNGYGLVSSRASYSFPCQVSEEVKKELFDNPKYDYLKFANEE